MRSHISVHRATPKYFSNSFVFKTKIEKQGLPRDSTPDFLPGRYFHYFFGRGSAKTNPQASQCCENNDCANGILSRYESPNFFCHEKSVGPLQCRSR